MAIDGAAVAELVARGLAFMQGETPDLLVPCTDRGKPTGTGIPFLNEARSEGLDVIDAGTRSDGDMQVFVGTRLPDGALFKYDAAVWKITRVEYDRAAGSDWPHRVFLVRHAS